MNITKGTILYHSSSVKWDEPVLGKDNGLFFVGTDKDFLKDFQRFNRMRNGFSMSAPVYIYTFTITKDIDLFDVSYAPHHQHK